MYEIQKNLKIMAMQYKLAMLIGLSLDLDKMLSQFLPETLSILNCTAGHILIHNKYEKKLDCIYSYPQSNVDHCEKLKNKVDIFYNDFFNTKSENKHYQLIEENKYIYFLMIGTIGVISLETRTPFEKETIVALRPIFSRLEIAYKACLQYGITETSYHEIFEHSPIALFELDCSALREYLLKLKVSGVRNIDAYLHEHKDQLNQFYALIKFKNINFHMLKLYETKNQSVFLENIDKMFGESSLPLVSKMFAAMTNADKYFHGEGITQSLSGKKIDIDLTYSMLPIHEHTFERVLFSIVDITELKLAESRLEFLATHDFLTGLPNRVLLHHALEIAMNRTYRSKKGMALLYLDLDDFKLINDNLGHEVGDNFLIQIAKKLKSLIRADDCVARVGGDEFVIVINNIASKDEMVMVADKIQKNVSITYKVDKHQLDATVSIGAAYYPTKNETYTGLMRHADSALYEAKFAGKNCVKIYESNGQNIKQ